MAIVEVRGFFKGLGRDNDIMEFETSSATVGQAADIIGVEEARIAKTLTFKNKDDDNALLVVAAGDAKIDNKKFKAEFGFKAKMMAPEEVLNHTGHAVGGVCPFGLKKDIPVYTDISIKRFDTVFPACGSSNSAIELTCADLYKYSKSTKWVDVCKDWK